MYFDTLYNKEPTIAHEKNPGFKARNSLDFINFEIIRPSGVKNIKLVIHKEHSLSFVSVILSLSVQFYSVLWLF
jgi:hypothetical protein